MIIQMNATEVVLASSSVDETIQMKAIASYSKV